MFHMQTFPAVDRKRILSAEDQRVIEVLVGQIYSWINDPSASSRPCHRLHIRNSKTNMAVEITKTTCAIQADDGSLFFPLDCLFEDCEYPQTSKQLRESLDLFVDVTSTFQYRIPLEEADIYQTGVVGPKQNAEVHEIICYGSAEDDLQWKNGGMQIGISKKDGRSRADFMLMASKFSAVVKVRRYLQKAALEQLELERTKTAAREKRKAQLKRAVLKEKKAKAKEDAEKKAKQAEWDRCVKRICDIADDVMKSRSVVHAGTVLKCVEDPEEEFGKLYHNPEFRRLELKQVNGSFRAADSTSSSHALDNETEKESGPVKVHSGSNNKKPCDLQTQILLLEKEISRLKKEQADQTPPPPYPG